MRYTAYTLTFYMSLGLYETHEIIVGNKEDSDGLKEIWFDLLDKQKSHWIDSVKTREVFKV